MSKVLLFSDLHLHNHKGSVDRLQDCLAVLNWVFRTAAAKGCSHIFFLGDLLHERSKIDVLNYLRMFETFLKHRGKFNIHLLIGNHDMYHQKKWDVNSVKPLTAINGITVIDQPQVIDLEGVHFAFLPHTENPLPALKKLKADCPDGKRILLAHLAVDGAELNKMYGTKADVIVEYDSDMVRVGPEVFDHWDRTFLGHYHSAQKLTDKVEYLGSPLQLTFGEAFQRKHIAVLDLEDLSTEYVVNDFSPQHFILGTDELDKYDLKGHFVRLAVDSLAEQDIVDKRKQLTLAGAASVDVMRKEKTVVVEQEQATVQDARSILTDQRKMLDFYIQHKGLPAGVERDKLVKLWDEVRRRVGKK